MPRSHHTQPAGPGAGGPAVPGRGHDPRVFVRLTQDKARDLWHSNTASAHNRLPKLAQAMEEAEDDVLATMSFFKAHRTKLHGTNTLERLNREDQRA